MNVVMIIPTGIGCEDECYLVDNYIDAAGMIASKMAGVTVESVRKLSDIY